MDDQVRRALTHSQVIDITTTGRRSGEPRRIEIYFHAIDGRIYISGMPTTSTRAWMHNLMSDPTMTIHLKGSVSADIPATARVIDDPTERRRIFEWITAHAWANQDVEKMLAYSPLSEVVPDLAAA